MCLPHRPRPDDKQAMKNNTAIELVSTTQVCKIGKSLDYTHPVELLRP